MYSGSQGGHRIRTWRPKLRRKGLSLRRRHQPNPNPDSNPKNIPNRHLTPTRLHGGHERNAWASRRAKAGGSESPTGGEEEQRLHPPAHSCRGRRRGWLSKRRKHELSLALQHPRAGELLLVKSWPPKCCVWYPPGSLTPRGARRAGSSLPDRKLPRWT